ncbi:MAG: OmpA family protein [Microcoleus sp. SIO2G3]|nr:OmpA family protein [Microcoleus sp. SIO2G3]
MTQSANSAAKTPPDKPSRYPWLLVLIFRLLLLGVGGGVALISGIAFANIYPNPSPEKPLLIKLLERLENKTPITTSDTSPTVAANTSNSSLELTPVQQQQAQDQLTQLQNQLRALSDAVAALESQLGINRSNEALDTRLQAIALQIQGVPAPSANATPIRNASTNQIGASSVSIVQSDKLKVTLPSDLLFEENNSILRSEAGLILDKIIADLRKYPSSTIRIGAHTDSNGEAEDNRELSFRRAKAVEQYFANALDGEYRWLVVGYGAAQPLVTNDTAADQQRNRRVEIAVN